MRLSSALSFFFLVLSWPSLGTSPLEQRQHSNQSSFDERHRQALSKNPAGVTFVIRLKNGNSQFRQGEIVPIELAFSSSTPRKYQLDGATYDRSGRLSIDTFYLDPSDGAVDPLRDYFGSGVLCFAGGGGRAMPILEEKPYCIVLHLNEWFRFDKPGKYRLYVSSRRINTDEQTGLVVSSNLMEFEIVPADVQWAGQTLRRALQTIDSRADGANRREACRVLRFLGSEAALREMMDRFKGSDPECDFEYMAGLIGFANRSLVVREMEDRLEAPDHPLSFSFLQTLSLLVFTLQYADSLPPYPSGDQAKIKLWNEDLRRRQDLFKEVMTRYLARAAAAVSNKHDQARAITLDTLLELGSSRPDLMNAMDFSAWRQKLPGEMAPVFHYLPTARQYVLLEYWWDRLAGPPMKQVLRNTWESPPQTVWPLRATALRRLYELDPVEGRRLILEEIRRPSPRVGIEVLGLLPDKALAEMDEVIAENLERTRENYEDMQIHCSILARYATEAILPRVKEIYGENGGRLACAIQYPMLAYLQRVDHLFGTDMIKKALAARGEEHTACYRSLLTDIARLNMRPELQQIALEHLEDPEPEVTANAASLLGSYGSADVQIELWKRFEKWHQQWKGREDELRSRIAEANPHAGEVHLEIALLKSLAQGAAWLTDADGLLKVRQLCLTSQEQRDADRMIHDWNGPLRISVRFGVNALSGASVAQYELTSLEALRKKLSQFSPGTLFVWRPSSNSHSAESEQLFAQLKTFLQERGMKLGK